MRKGILVASFGTTYQDTREKNIDAIVKCVKEKYKDVDVYEAYTSSKIRKALEKDGIKKYSVEEALEIMAGDGITHVAILPTHVIDGIESEIVKADVLKMRNCFEDIKVAGVLLNSPEDYNQISVLFQRLGSKRTPGTVGDAYQDFSAGDFGFITFYS